jgi:hypothetical protein
MLFVWALIGVILILCVVLCGKAYTKPKPHSSPMHRLNEVTNILTLLEKRFLGLYTKEDPKYQDIQELQQKYQASLASFTQSYSSPRFERNRSLYNLENVFQDIALMMDKYFPRESDEMRDFHEIRDSSYEWFLDLRADTYNSNT